LAHARGARLLLDVSSYERDHVGRQYRLDRFCIRGLPVKWSSGILGRLQRGVQRRLPDRWRLGVFTEQQLNFDSRLLRIHRSVELRGYWQSERYFSAIAPLLRKELRLRKRATGRNAELAQEISGSESVSLHVRRGDYVANSSHVVLAPAYYAAALDRLSFVAQEAHYYVFSDDISWCRENLYLPGRATFVDHNGPEADYEDMRLMSLCKHHVIANSSFSWWGAWLGETTGQTVIAPRLWFVDPSRSSRDMVPEGWERI